MLIKSRSTVGCYSGTGCSWTDSDSKTYGQGFNDNGGGVFATLFTDTTIQIWTFPRDSVPDGIADSPDYSTWGDPQASWGTACDISTYFAAQQMIFDITLCGQWAGQDSVWQADATCSAMGTTCGDVVMSGANFKEVSPLRFL